MAFYFGVFKEPRGLIRFLQFVFAICAFATACNGGSSLTIETADKNLSITASWSYPFNLADSQAILTNASSSKSVSLNSNNKASAEFFVFTGVMAMIFSLAFLIVYIFLDRLYRSNQNIAFVELIITLVWVVFWLAGSSAWAKGVTNIRSATSTDNILQLFAYNNGNNDWNQTSSPNHGNIIVSVIFGFLNFALWLGSVWFVYKETRFFKSNSSQQNQFSNIAGSTFPNPTQTGQQNPMR